MTTTAFLPPELAPRVLRFDPAAARPPLSEGHRRRTSIGGCDTIGFFVAVFSVAPLVPREGWAARAAAAAAVAAEEATRALTSEKRKEGDDGEDDDESESGVARSGVESLSLHAA